MSWKATGQTKRNTRFLENEMPEIDSDIDSFSVWPLQSHTCRGVRQHQSHVFWNWARACPSLLANEPYWLLVQLAHLSWDHQWVNPLSSHLRNHSQMSHPCFLGLPDIITRGFLNLNPAVVHAAAWYTVPWCSGWGSPLVKVFPAVTFNTSFFLFLCMLSLK